MRFDVEVPTSREGFFVPAPFGGPKEIIRVIQTAESLGFNAVWGTDFITPVKSMGIPDKAPPNWYELLICLAYVAAVTKKIKLGTGVILLPYRDPVILAKQAATLDQFSGGRLLLGLGLGSREEFDAIRPREKNAHRGKMMDEKLEALKVLLDHENKEVNFEGEYVEFHGVNLNPKPLQKPLPMYVPGRTPDALERIARWGLGCMIRASDVGPRLDALRPILDKHGRDLSEIDVAAEAQLSLAKTHDAAVKSYQKSRLGQTNTRRQDINKIVAVNWIGTPAEVVESIIMVKELGVTHFIALHIAGDTVGEMIEQMRIFAEEVIPHVESA